MYDLAVERFRQPMRAIRDVNPDVSAHQCHAWLRRARELGFVRTPAQERTPAPLPELPATAERVAADDLARRVLEDEQVKLWAWNDIPLTAERLESTLVGKRMTAEQRRHVLDVLAGAAPGHEAADG